MSKKREAVQSDEAGAGLCARPTRVHPPTRGARRGPRPGTQTYPNSGLYEGLYAGA
mgnify:CR=1 FL=1